MRTTLFLSLFIILSITLVFVFTGCKQEKEEEKEPEVIIQPAAPVINIQPADVLYFAGQTISSLTVRANSPDKSTLSYQWYSNTTSSVSEGTLIEGAINNQYMPTETTDGTYYYYVVVTSTNPDAEITTSETYSNVAKIIFTSMAPPNADFTVDTNTKYQYVRGFGAMDTNWGTVPAGHTLTLSINDYENMFDPEKLGYTMMRIMILPANTNPATTIDNITRVPGGSRQNYLEGVKIVNKYGGYVLATPWTPPAAWKSNNALVGGTPGNHVNLRPQHYQDYANYLKNFCIEMANRGAPIYAISIQNEPNFTGGNYDGCDWTPEEMRDFLKQVGHFTTGVPGYGGGKVTPHVLIMNGETMHDPSLNNAALNDPVSRNVIDVLGRHIYGWRMQFGIEQHGKEMWMTEYNINSGAENAHLDVSWNYVWLFLNSVDLTMRLNNENAYIWWTARRFYSIISEGLGGTTAGQILPRGHALSHYSKFASGTNRVAVTASGTTRSGSGIITDGADANINHTTFYNEEGSDPTPYVHSVKVSAFESLDGNSISLVMFTPTRKDGSNGINMGTVKIQLPEGFIIGSATAMRSNSNVKSQPEEVLIGIDNNSAYVTLPDSNILSVRFTSKN